MQTKSIKLWNTLDLGFKTLGYHQKRVGPSFCLAEDLTATPHLIAAIMETMHISQFLCFKTDLCRDDKVMKFLGTFYKHAPFHSFTAILQ